MPRTVVPPARFRSDTGNAAAGGDPLPERLVKYVPAETLAFFVPTVASVGPERRGLTVVILLAGVLGTLGYLWLASRNTDPAERPLPHFFGLAVLAFICWAIGTSSNVSDLIGIDRLTAGIILGLAVFLIPMLDGVVAGWARRR